MASAFQRVLENDPQNPEATFNLAAIQLNRGQFHEAAVLAAKACELDSENFAAWDVRGWSALRLHRLNEAEASFVAAIRLAPENPSPILGLAATLLELGRSEKAVVATRRILELAPGSFPAKLYLARALRRLGDYEKAASILLGLETVRPDSVPLLIELAGVLALLSRESECKERLDKALRLEGPSAGIYAQRGEILESLGRLEDAAAEYSAALALEPSHPRSCLALVRSRTLSEADEALVAGMISSLEQAGLGLAERADLNYAIGKAFEDLSRFKESMEHYDEANRFVRERFRVTADAIEAFELDAQKRIELFTPSFMQQHRDAGTPVEMPVLVVGMVRSGTTLTEHILARHPDIGAGHEDSFWFRRSGEACSLATGELREDHLTELAADYVKGLQGRAQGKRFVIDKMPTNFEVLPLIHLALPNSRIIHLRRHPVATCLSVYSTPNVGLPTWARDKETLARYYRAYLRSMAAWRLLIPADRFLEIDYEELVNSTETVLKRALGFLGLKWHAACLDDKAGGQSAPTPSNRNVARPVFSDSIDRWRNFEPWLGPLRSLLREDNPTLP